MHTFPVPHWLFKVHGTHVPLLVEGIAEEETILQYPIVQSSFEVHESVLPAGGGVCCPDGVHAALHHARHADSQLPAVPLPAFVSASLPEAVEPVPAFAALLTQTFLAASHERPAAHGAVAEHVWPAVLAAGGVIATAGNFGAVIVIAFPVGIVILKSPPDIAPEAGATAAAHLPTLAAPNVNVTMLAQLLLLQSAFSLQTPPVACGGTQ